MDSSRDMNSQTTFDSIMQQRVTAPEFHSQDEWSLSRMTLADVSAVAKTTQTYPMNVLHNLTGETPDDPRANYRVNLNGSASQFVETSGSTNQERETLAKKLTDSLKYSWDGLPDITDADSNKFAVATMLDRKEADSFYKQYVDKAENKLKSHLTDAGSLVASGMGWLATSAALGQMASASSPEARLALKAVVAVAGGGLFSNLVNRQSWADSSGYIDSAELLAVVGGTVVLAEKLAVGKELGLATKASAASLGGLLVTAPALGDLTHLYNAKSSFSGSELAMRKALSQH